MDSQRRCIQYLKADKWTACRVDSENHLTDDPTPSCRSCWTAYNGKYDKSVSVADAGEDDRRSNCW